MGDLLSPKRRDVFDRLRRRIEQYRRCHSVRLNQYQGSVPSLYEQQNHDLRLLRQRWEASRAKRVAKPSKSKDNSSNQEQRSLAHTVSLLGDAVFGAGRVGLVPLGDWVHDNTVLPPPLLLARC